MSDVFGSGMVRILPDFSEFDAAFQSGVAAAVAQADQAIRQGLSAAAGAPVAVNIDTAGVTGAVQAAVDGADSTVNVAADTAGVTGVVEAAVDAADSTVDVNADTAGVTGAVEAAVDGADSMVTVTADTGQIPAAVENAVDVGDSMVTVTADTSQAQGAVSELTQELDQANEASGRLGGGLRTLVAAASGLVAGKFIQAGASYNTLLQTTSAALETLLGSGEAAGAMLDEVTTFARTSPFPRQLWIEATQTLIGFGTEAEDVIPMLAGIQDAVAATGGSAQDISEVVRVLSQVQSSNRFTAETFNQLAVRGVDAATLIGGEFEMTAGEVREAVRKGTLDAGEMLDALAAGMTGTFGGAAEGVRDTWVGAVDRINGAIRDISATLLTGFIDPEGGGAGVELANQIADTLREFESSRLPRIVDAIEPFYDLLLSIADVAAPTFLVAMDSLVPILEVTGLTMGAMVPVFEVLAVVLEAIPGPLLSTAGAFLAMSRAASTLRLGALLTGAATGARAFGASMAGAATSTGLLTRAATGATGAMGRLRASMVGGQGVAMAAVAAGTAWSSWQGMMADAQRSGSEAIRGIVADVDMAAMSEREIRQLNSTLASEASRLRQVASESSAPWDADYRAELRAGASEIGVVIGENEKLIESMRRATWEEWAAGVNEWNSALAANLLGGTEGLTSLLEAEAQGVVDALVWIRDTGDTSAGSMLNLALQIDAAALSGEEMEAAAAALGVELDVLEGFVEDVNGAIEDFVSDAVSGLPTVADALRDANDDGKVSTREFIAALQEDAASMLVWQANIRTIASAGFVELAAELARLGPEAGSAMADELATAAAEGNAKLLEETSTALGARNNAYRIANENFARLGEQWVRETGFVATAASNAFGANFDPAGQAAIQMALAESGLSAQGQQIAVIAATEGARAATEWGQALDLDQKVVDEAVAVGLSLRTMDLSEDGAVAAGNLSSSILNPLLGQLMSGRVSLVGIGRAWVQGINEGMIAEQQALERVSAAMARMVPNVIGGLWRTGSPSRVAMEFGGWFAEGLADGIAAGEGLVADAAAATAGTATAALGEPFEAMAAWSPSGTGASVVAVGDRAPAASSVGTVIVERIELPSTEPELAASAIVNGLVAIETVVGSR